MSASRDKLPQTYIPVRYDLILPDFLREFAEVLCEGAEKYGINNWQNIPLDEHLNHAMAHITSYREGDRSERHFINITCRIMFAYWCDKMQHIAVNTLASARDAFFDAQLKGIDISDSKICSKCQMRYIAGVSQCAIQHCPMRPPPQ